MSFTGVIAVNRLSTPVAIPARVTLTKIGAHMATALLGPILGSRPATSHLAVRRVGEGFDLNSMTP